MNYDLLRAYTGDDLRDAIHAEYLRVANLDRRGILSLLRRTEIAAAIVMVEFRKEYTQLERAIKRGDGTDEDLYFAVEDAQDRETPIASIQRLTGGRTIILDVERLEMMGVEAFVQGAIEGRF